MPLFWMNQALLDARYVLRGASSLSQDNVIIKPNSNGGVFKVQNASGTDFLVMNTTTGSLINNAATDMVNGSFRSVRPVFATDYQSLVFHNEAGGTHDAIIGRDANSDVLKFGFHGGSGFEERLRLTLLGGLNVNTLAELAVSAADGMLAIPTMNGAPNAVTVTQSGGAILVYDRAAHELNIHYGGTWRSVAVT